MGACIIAAGCANISKTVTDGAALVRQTMDAILPSDFSGPVDLSRVDGYIEIRLKGGGIHKNEKGEWTWKWIEYERKTHIPWFSGAQWTSDVHFKFGEP